MASSRRTNNQASSSAGGKKSKSSDAQQDNVKAEVLELFSGALPSAAVGALAGVAAFVMYGLVNAPKVKKIKQDDVLKHYKYIMIDTPLVDLCKKIQLSCCIHPKWFPAILDHVNFICHSWITMHSFTKEIGTLVPKETSPSNHHNSSNLFGAVKDMAESSVFTIKYILGQIQQAAAHAFSGSQHQQQEQNTKKSKAPGNSTQWSAQHFTAANERIDVLMKESNHILEAVVKSRITIAGLMTEFISIASLFNAYWEQTGPTIQSDPDLLHEQVAIDLCERKLTTVKHLSETGFLPDNDTASTKYGVLQDAMTREFVKWWVLMHTTFLPSMYYTCQSMGWQSVYNPHPSQDEESNQQPQHVPSGIRYGSATGSGGIMSRLSGQQQSTAGAGEGNVVDEMGRWLTPQEMEARAQNSAKRNTIPGHAFKQSGKSQTTEYQLNQEASKSNGARAPVQKAAQFAKKQQAEITRPSTNSNLQTQATFWVQRVRTEGWKKVISQPWAGFLPCVEEHCFLLTAFINIDSVKANFNQLLTLMDAKIEGIYTFQHKLLKIAADLKRHWHPSLFEEGSELYKEVSRALPMHEYWRGLGRAQH